MDATNNSGETTSQGSSNEVKKMDFTAWIKTYKLDSTIASCLKDKQMDNIEILKECPKEKINSLNLTHEQQDKILTALQRLRTEEPQPVKIVDVDRHNDQKRFVFYPERLEEILKDHQNKKVAVLAVAGAYRTGKSFLLSYIAKKLTSQKLNDDAALKGWFRWKGGSHCVTTGINVWNRPIIVKEESGEEIVVLLLDSQGTFSHDSTLMDSTKIFALSILLSSTLIYNIKSMLSNDHLQHLKMWMEYGKLALSENKNNTPFQGLLFLVRDWQNKTEYEYGNAGGDAYIADVKHQGRQERELRSLRDDIFTYFAPVTCFLLPHIGNKALDDPKFDGSIYGRGVRRVFKTHFEELLHLLKEKYIKVKAVNGLEITGKDLIGYFKEYASLFESNEMPEPLSTFEANAKVYNPIAIQRCLEQYKDEMEKALSKNGPLTEEDMTTLNNKVKAKTLDNFAKRRPMGGHAVVDACRKELEGKLFTEFATFETRNDDTFKEAKLVNAKAANECLDIYRQSMENDLGDNTKTNEKQVRTSNDKAQKQALETFSNKRMGKKKIWIKKKGYLEEQMTKEFKVYLIDAFYNMAVEKHRNDLREIFENRDIKRDERTKKNEEFIKHAIGWFEIETESYTVGDIVTDELERKLGVNFTDLKAEYTRKMTKREKVRAYAYAILGGVATGASTGVRLSGPTLNPVVMGAAISAGGIVGGASAVVGCFLYEEHILNN